jgi:YD repeat-containing protein
MPAANKNQRVFFSYSDDGKLVRKSASNQEGKVIWTEDYLYNDAERLIVIDHKELAVESSQTSHTRTAATYDMYGNLLTVEATDNPDAANGGSVIGRSEFFYDCW